MLRENGVTDRSAVQRVHPSVSFVSRSTIETDYDFLCRMAAEEGIFFYEEHAQKVPTRARSCATPCVICRSPLRSRNPEHPYRVSTLCISQFRYSAQIRPSSVVTKRFTPLTPGWAGRFDQEGQHRGITSAHSMKCNSYGRFKGCPRAELCPLADGWLAKQRRSGARNKPFSGDMAGTANCAPVGHPQANLNQEWQVVASELRRAAAGSAGTQ